MRKKRGWKAACAAIVALSAAGWAAAAERPFLGGFITESHVLYPLRVGDWEAQGEHRYEDPAYGVSVRYRDGRLADRWLDLYFYPAGKLDDARLREVVEDARREMLALAGRADAYEAVEAGAPEHFELRTGEDGRQPALPVYLVPLRMTAKGRSYTSVLALLVQDMYFVKLRYSAPAEEAGARQMRAQARDFLQALVRRSRTVSTGACWDPLPVVVRDALDAHAEGALMNSTLDGRVIAVAFADRVEVREGDSLAGELMRRLASLHTGRIADPSCVAPEDVNVQVGEGMREIRMEYRAPPPADAIAPAGAGSESRD